MVMFHNGKEGDGRSTKNLSEIVLDYNIATVR